MARRSSATTTCDFLINIFNIFCHRLSFSLVSFIHVVCGYMSYLTVCEGYHIPCALTPLGARGWWAGVFDFEERTVLPKFKTQGRLRETCHDISELSWHSRIATFSMDKTQGRAYIYAQYV